MTDEEHTPHPPTTPETPNSSDTYQLDSSVPQLMETVSSWPGITTGTGRFNSTTFQIGRGEIGHVHPQMGLVDISYPQPLREQLLAEGHTAEHHMVPERATTFTLESDDNLEQALFLLRLSYLYHVSGLDRSTDSDNESIEIDVEGEIRELNLSDELHSILTQLVR